MWLIFKTTESTNELFTILESRITENLIKTFITCLQNYPELTLGGKLIGSGKFHAVRIATTQSQLTELNTDLDENSNKVADFADDVIKHVRSKEIAVNITKELLTKLTTTNT